MAKPAEQVVDQRPAVAEEDDSADPAAEKAVDGFEMFRAGRKSDEPDGDEDRAEIKRSASDAVHDRRHHGRNGTIDLQMWGEGPVLSRVRHIEASERASRTTAKRGAGATRGVYVHCVKTVFNRRIAPRQALTKYDAEFKSIFIPRLSGNC